ncbi:hypothetical protein FRC04_006941 [Tulasnella sp. 424]|nr:hypothetical protein FRC04_006941 [Tulasnella sp. 424]
MCGMDDNVAPAHTNSKQNKTTVNHILQNLSWLRTHPDTIELDNERQVWGGQADVTTGILKRIAGQSTRVAVKKLRYGDDTDNDKFSKSFVGEVDILAGLSHPNIVKLLGFLEDLENGEACMIFAWEENGNVQQFLAKRKCDVPERVSLVKDVTAGLEYLHIRQPPICHGDLKSLNILVNSSCRAVIADFGSARVLRRQSKSKADRKQLEPNATVPSRKELPNSSPINISVTGNQLTLTGPSWSFRWAAREVLLGEDPDLPSDIWALGWVIWEIVTGKLPFHELNNDIAITLAVIELPSPWVGRDAQMSQIVALCTLVMDCLAHDPTSRPTATKCCASVKWTVRVPHIFGRNALRLALQPSVVPTCEIRSDVKARSAALLLTSGYMHYSQDDYETAAAFFNKALANANSENDASSAAECQNWLGEVYLAQKRHDEAKRSFSKAQGIYTSLGNDEGLVRSLDGLGGVYHARRRYDEAGKFFLAAEKICVRMDDDVGRAQVLNGIGAVRLAQHRYNDARNYFVQALAVHSRVGNHLGQANSLSGLGSVDYAQCRYEGAMESFVKAESVYRRIGNSVGRADTLSGVAAVLLKQRRYSEARECYVQALDIHNRIDNHLGQANSMNGLERENAESEAEREVDVESDAPASSSSSSPSSFVDCDAVRRGGKSVADTSFSGPSSSSPSPSSSSPSSAASPLSLVKSIYFLITSLSIPFDLFVSALPDHDPDPSPPPPTFDSSNDLFWTSPGPARPSVSGSGFGAVKHGR